MMVAAAQTAAGGMGTEATSLRWLVRTFQFTLLALVAAFPPGRQKGPIGIN